MLRGTGGAMTAAYSGRDDQHIPPAANEVQAMRPSVLPTALAIAVMLAAVALPVAATDPGSDALAHSTDERAEVEEQPITVAGTMATSIDADGEKVYTLQSGAETYVLEAGPSWYWGDDHPLGPYVGMDVSITGERPVGTTEIDVLSVDGTVLREPGKPPWAGGWKRVGELHPGWTQAKADRYDATVADCFPPGQCKHKPSKLKASKGQGHHSDHELGVLGRLLVLLVGGRDRD